MMPSRYTFTHGNCKRTTGILPIPALVCDLCPVSGQEVFYGPESRATHFADVRSDGRKLVMFLEDVQNRGEAVTEKRARGGI